MQTIPEESHLEEVELFADLDSKDLQAFEPYTRVSNLSKDAWVYMEGDPRSHVYYLSSGRIKIFRLTHDGKEFILEFVEPGEIFGETSILEEGPEDSYGIAAEDSTVLVIPAARFAHFLTERPDFMLKLARLVSHRKKRMETRLVMLAFHTVRARLARLLLQLAEAYGVRRPRGIQLQIRLSRQEMGGLIGASREIVSHTISDYRREGLIEVDGRSLIILRTEALEQLGSCVEYELSA